MNDNRDKFGKFAKKHGKKNTKLYRVWCSMKERCYNEHNKSYKNYGLRGIKVCDQWKNDFEEFYKWAMKHGYTEGLTIDRIDFNKDYCPNNCRWVTTKQQNRNYNKNHFVKYKGKKMCLKELSEKSGIPYTKLRWRIENWGSVELALQKGDKRYGSKTSI